MRKAEVINHRKIYWAAAYCAWVCGVILTLWGPIWFGTDLAGEPFLKAALVRIFGAVVIADGCFAGALASADFMVQRRGARWFAAAHATVFAVVMLQRIAILGPGPADIVLTAIVAAAFLFGYFWETADGVILRRGRTLITLFTRRPAAVNTQSAYETHIRKAAAQEERNRLARDLHDSIKQQLFVIQTAAATAQTRYDFDSEGTKEALARVRVSAREAMTEMEVMLDQLQAVPLENLGLTEALKRACEALRHRIGAEVRLDTSALPESAAWPVGAHEALYRIAQEALSNVARHSRARKVVVDLRPIGNVIQLSVADDGSGFGVEQSRGGMGLRSMRSRVEELGGEFETTSKPGRGVTLHARIPVAEPVPPRNYLNRAALWFLFFAWWLHEFLSRDSWVHGVGCVLMAIAATRDLTAYLRGRKLADEAN